MTKIIRSWLFVPADSEKKLSKSKNINADALIFDLEDAVLPQNKNKARDILAEFLGKNKISSQIWVRINPLDSEFAIDDLQAIIPLQPSGIVLPKPDGPVDVEVLSNIITDLERKNRLPLGKVKIMAVATETARAVTSLNLYSRTYLPRLLGLAWGAEDLSMDLGALGNRDENGEFDFTYKMVRSQTLIAANAAKIQAIETLYADFKDADGLYKMAISAFRQGFNGMLAIHPAQIEIINKCFMPNAAQLRHAYAVIEAFAKSGEAGAVSLRGKMLDRPHLLQAENLVNLAKKYDENS